MKTILINGLQISDKNTGVQQYAKYLYQELNKIETSNLKFFLIRSPADEVLSPHSFHHSLDPGYHSHKSNRIKRILYENFFLPSYLSKNDLDLYHSTNYVLPCFSNFPSVLTIHDLLTLDYPELCQVESVLYFKLLLSRSIKRAIKIIAVSNVVKNDILRHFAIPKEKIEVVFHGINPIFKQTMSETIQEKYNLPDKYILFVGNIEPKKNLIRLIEAFDQLKRKTGIKHKLILVGKNGWKYRSVYKTISKLCIAREIQFTGYVPEEDLSGIYSLADIFVFPSLYEGFGLPPLEAMACETPVLTSDKGALPEVTGCNCLRVNPFDIDEIAKGMYRLLTDETIRRKLIKNGKIWAANFTWSKAAEKTMKVYEEALTCVK